MLKIEKFQMLNRAKYIVLVSIGIGGAEKRFFDIFRSLKDCNSNVFLVVSATLYEKLSITSKENIIVIGNSEDSLFKFTVNYFKWLRTLKSVKASFHYPMNCLFFFHFFMPHKVSMSLTNCYFAPKLFTFKRSLIRQYISLFFVSRVDVLNPDIYKNISKFKFTSFTLTPNGTYVHPEIVHLSEKKPLYGFIGRLISGKGLEEFLKKIPEIWESLQFKVDKDFSFFIAGYGVLEKMVEQEVSNLQDTDIPIVFYGYRPAEELLKSARLVFSLQEKTNYPSRVVAEAMLNGCSVLVTDTGDSRNFGSFDSGLNYINPVLDTVEIVNQILRNESKYKDDVAYPRKVREEALHKFSSEETLTYFMDILS